MSGLNRASNRAAWSKNRSEYKAPSQSTLNGHISKGIWVALRGYRWLGALCFYEAKSRPTSIGFL